MFRKEDIAQIEQRGSSVQTVEQQVERFKQGFPWMKIVAPATPERGIQVLDDAAVEAAANYYDGAVINGKCKFVPASGAASRMFKDLFSGLDALRQVRNWPMMHRLLNLWTGSRSLPSIHRSFSVSRLAGVLSTGSRFFQRLLLMKVSAMVQSQRES